MGVEDKQDKTASKAEWVYTHSTIVKHDAAGKHGQAPTDGVGNYAQTAKQEHVLACNES